MSYDGEALSEKRKARRQKYLDLLGGKCERCSSKKNLHFDHLNPKKKEFTIAKKPDSNEATLTKEVMKCQLLCADCHADKTRENWEYTHPESKHGTVWRYKKYKCRCPDCKKSMSDYYRSKLDT